MPINNVDKGKVLMKVLILFLCIILGAPICYSEVTGIALNISRESWEVVDSRELIKKNITIILNKKNQKVRGFFLKNIEGLAFPGFNLLEKTKNACKVKTFKGRIYKIKNKNTCILSKVGKENTIKQAIFFTLLKLENKRVIVKNILTFSAETTLLTPYKKEIEGLFRGLQQ